MSRLSERPVGITIMSIALFIIGIIFVVVSFLPLDILVFRLIAFIVGIASLVCAYGLFRGKPWSWLLTIIILILGIIILIYNGLMVSPEILLVYIFIGLLLGLGIYYMQRSTVKSYLNKF
jgi:hypothetical protein